MKTLEIRALLKGVEKEIPISSEIQNVYKIWRSKRKGEVDPMDIFYAGYILANPIVREQYVKSELKINQK